MKKVINIMSFFIMLVGCAQKKVVPAEYTAYLKEPEHGLIKNMQIGEWLYSIAFKPRDFLILQEFKNSNDTAAIRKRRENLKGTVWFTISFRLKDGNTSPLRTNLSSYEEYNQRLDYYLNKASGVIELVHGSDTMKPSSYLFETNYNLTPQETIVVGFSIPEKEAVDGDLILSFRDDIFKNGIIKARFTSKDINHIPGVIF